MLGSTLLVVSTALKGPLVNRLLHHSRSFYCAPDFDTARTYLMQVCVPESVPDLTILECLPDLLDPVASLCQELVPRLEDQQFLILVNDPPEIPLQLKHLIPPYKFQVRVVAPYRLLSVDLLNWLSPVSMERSIRNDEFMFRLATQDVMIMGGPEPYTVKLTYSQNIILEYLLIHAAGVENRKNARQIFEGVWGDKYHSFNDRDLRKTIQSLRDQLEKDPKKPQLILSYQGRNGGYYIRKPVMSAESLAVGALASTER